MPEYITYSCPNCHQDLSFGNAISLYVKCPKCFAEITLDKNRNIKVLKNFHTESPHKVYGRDKLLIEQMYPSQKEAIAAGHSHFFTGRPCKHGHIAPRTKKNVCNECTRIRVKKYSDAHRDKIRAKAKKHYWEMKKNKKSSIRNCII